MGETATKQKNKFRFYIRLLWIFFISVLLFIVIYFYCIAQGKLGYMPSFEELENPKSNLASVIYSADKKNMGTFFKDNRINVNYDELSPHLVDALIATEDYRFRNHSGIDYMSLGRVVVKTVLGGNRNAGGGSTISQQLAKLLFPRERLSSKGQIINRKLREWVIAVKLEKRYTKDEILTMYLNHFDFLNLAVGIKSASKVYFNKTQDSLKIEEAAMLIGMAKNPSLFNPLRFYDTTMHRRNVVMKQMVKYNYLDSAVYDSLRLLPIELNYQKVDHNIGSGTYIREYIRITMNAKEPIRKNYSNFKRYKEDSARWNDEQLYGWVNKNPKNKAGNTYNIYKDGLRIYTTINSKMQLYAEESVVEHLSKDIQPKFFKEQKNRKKAPFAWNVSAKQIKNIMNTSMRRTERYRVLKKAGLSQDSIKAVFDIPTEMTVFSWEGDIDTLLSPMDSLRYYKHFLHTGFMSVDPHSGHVKAYVGGANYRYFKYDHITSGKRQVGSTFKPLLYTLAMQNGYSPCYEVPNIPTNFIMPDGRPWEPKNAGDERDGEMVSLKWGLSYSVNYISAWLMKQFKPQPVIDIARKMGIKSYIPAVPSICLGVADISVYEMTRAYSTFANKGINVEPIFVTRIEDSNGNVLATFTPETKEAISEETAFLMLDMLQSVTKG